MPAATPWFIRARLKTRQLMLLTAICDEGNIHRAAAVLHMSQPAASKLLKDLEDMLGVTLFERQPRGMRPNWYGETLIRHARIALSSLREAGQEVDALKSGLAGHVSLGAITGPALSLVPQALALVARENPKLRVELHVSRNDLPEVRVRHPDHDVRRLDGSAVGGERAPGVGRGDVPDAEVHAIALDPRLVRARRRQEAHATSVRQAPARSVPGATGMPSRRARSL